MSPKRDAGAFCFMDRSLRRYYAEKARRRARQILSLWQSRSNGRFDYDARQVGMMAHTPAPCSCPMCGNPRRHFRQRTRQEKVAVERELAEMEEML